jgi:hypothetical protein
MSPRGSTISTDALAAVIASAVDKSLSDDADWSLTIPVKKASENPDGSVTFTGWASVVSDAAGNPIVDYDGEIIPVDELERAVHKAALEASGAGRAGVMHQSTGMIDVVESMVLTAAKREALGLGAGQEGWVVTCRSTDPEVVKAVRSGHMLEMSIRGTAVRERLDA